MNEFEKAVNTENYTGETFQENVIEWIRGDKEVTVTFCNNNKYKSKVQKLAEEYPDEVQIVATNNDGSIVAHLPLSYIRISHPPKRVLTDEQKKEIGERFKKYRKGQKNLEDEEQ